MDSKTLIIDGTGNTTFSGYTQFSGQFIKNGSGTLTIAGDNDNIGLGVLANAGTVVLAKASGFVPYWPYEVHAIGALNNTIAGGTVQLAGTGDDQIHNASSIALTSGTFDLNGHYEAFNALSLGGSGVGGIGALVNNAAGTTSVLQIGNSGFGTVNLTANTTVGGTGNLELWASSITGSFGLTKVGSGTLTLSSSTYAGGTTVNSGTLVATGSNPGPVTVNSGATLKGTANIAGSVSVADGGIVAPGISPGVLRVSGNYTQAATGQLQIELGGATLGSGYDQLFVGGAATLAGTLHVSFINNFSPLAGNTFDILSATTLSGTFDSLTLPPLDAGLMWNASDLYTAGRLKVTLAGDYNANGYLDAADYIVWRKTLGQTGTGLAADGDQSREIDADDYNVWRAHFGQTAPSGSGSSFNNPETFPAVPEPTSLVLLILAALTLAPTLSSPRRVYDPRAKENAQRRSSHPY